MIIRIIAPPMRMPMLLVRPALICWVKAGEPESSTFTPGGGLELLITDATLASTDFWTFSDNPGASFIWTRVSTLEGTTCFLMFSGKEPTIRSVSARDVGIVPPLALFKTSTTLTALLIFCCCTRFVSRLSIYVRTSWLSGSPASIIRMIESAL